MTGPGHHLAAVGAAVPTAYWAFTAFDPSWSGSQSILALCAAVGCVSGGKAPDWMELPVGNRRLITHRTLTHWLPLWIVAMASLFFIAIEPPMHAFLLGFCVGGIVHLSGDILTPMGVPILTPWTRWNLARLRSGGLQEALWVVGIWGISLASIWVPTGESSLWKI